MVKNELIKILNDWNLWESAVDTGIDRPYYLTKLKDFLATGQVAVITGARRSGKSFIMRQLAGHLISQGTDKTDILIVNFEDPRFAKLDAKILEKIYETYLEFLNPKNIPYIFLDEIQEVEGWERWVTTAHELNRAKIVISGSNAKLLGRELATLLTGRHLDLTVFPLSFKEYLGFRNITLTAGLGAITREIEIKRLLREYLEFGSFPKVVLSGEKKQILLDYFEDILNKDIVKRFGIRKTGRLFSLAKFYLSNVSSPTTFNSLEKSLEISSETIEKFSRFLEEAYILFFLKRFSFKVKEQEKSPRKVYAIDTGLANIIGLRTSPNIGRLVENLVFCELKRNQALTPGLELYYWKDISHREVDFVLKQDAKVKELIQVCWKVDELKTKKREVKALLKAMDELGAEEGLIINEDYEGEETFKEKKVIYIPLWKWLLN